MGMGKNDQYLVQQKPTEPSESNIYIIITGGVGKCALFVDFEDHLNKVLVGDSLLYSKGHHPSLIIDGIVLWAPLVLQSQITNHDQLQVVNFGKLPFGNLTI